MGADEAATIQRNGLGLNQNSSDELHARLDHISCNVHPVAPYLLTIPSHKPVELSRNQQRRFWVKGTLFPFDEGHLQYISNFSDWGQGLIQPVGGWDDGRGGIAKQEQLPKSSPMTPQHPPKRMKLGEYARKKAAADLQNYDAQPSTGSDAASVRRSVASASHRESPNPSAKGPRSVISASHRESPKPSARAPSSDRATKSSEDTTRVASGGPDDTSTVKVRPSPIRRSHEPFVPAEDLPPPLTPLPPRLAAVVAEYREHLRVNGASQTKAVDSTPAATRAYRRYQKRLQKLVNLTSNRSERRLLVTLRFRNKINQYKTLQETLQVRNRKGGKPVPDMTLESMARLKRLGERLVKEAKSSGSDRDSCILALEGVLSHLLYTKLLAQKKGDAREDWEESLKLLSEFAERHLSQTASVPAKHTPSSSPTGHHDKFGTLIRHLVDSWMSLLHRELAESPRCPELDALRGSELCLWLRAEALEYSLRASSELSSKKIYSDYPKVWDDSADSAQLDTQKDVTDWTNVILRGPFTFPVASGTSLQAIRATRRLLMKLCHEAEIEISDSLGAFAAKMDATA